MRRGRTRKLRAWTAEESGQVLILVAGALVLVLGAAALAIDWGYGLTQRRVTQNAADGGALVAGKTLAKGVLKIEGALAFSVSQEAVYRQALCVADANRDFQPAGATRGLKVYYGNSNVDNKPTPVPDPTQNTAAWIPSASVPSCTSPLTTATLVPADTVYVQVEAEITYRSLLMTIQETAQPIKRPTIRAAAAARVRLAGTGVPGKGPIWPMVRHYDPADFNITCKPKCTPLTVPPTTFWSPNEADVVYGSFKGLVDLSRRSATFFNAAGTVADQLITEWDQSGSAQATPPTALKVVPATNCSGGLWDTAGGEDPQYNNKGCSIPSWFQYTFSGSLSLGTFWSAASCPAGSKTCKPLPLNQEAPTPLTTRSVCGAGKPDPAPSCDTKPGSDLLGDWVETAGGNMGDNNSSAMLSIISSRGSNDEFSDGLVTSGPNKGNKFGKAFVALIYLWDCAETFTKTAAVGAQWDLIVPNTGSYKGDCSQLASGPDETPTRVHLFTVAPFTFYEGLVTSSAIEGYWGGAFGEASGECLADPSKCAPLNPLANTAFLVPTD